MRPPRGVTTAIVPFFRYRQRPQADKADKAFHARFSRRRCRVFSAKAHFSLAEVLHKAKASPDEVLAHAKSARTIYANGDAPDDLAEVDAFLEERSASRTAPAKTSRR